MSDIEEDIKDSKLETNDEEIIGLSKRIKELISCGGVLDLTGKNSFR